MIALRKNRKILFLLIRLNRLLLSFTCPAAQRQKQAQPIAVVDAIGSTQAGWRQRFEQAAGDGCVATLAGRYDERDGTTATIDNSMDLCRSPAARAADRLEFGPPFPPALQR